MARTNARLRSTVDLILTHRAKRSDSRRLRDVRLSEKPPGFLNLVMMLQTSMRRRGPDRDCCNASDLGPRGPGRPRGGPDRSCGIGRTGASTT